MLIHVDPCVSHVIHLVGSGLRHHDPIACLGILVDRFLPWLAVGASLVCSVVTYPAPPKPSHEPTKRRLLRAVGIFNALNADNIPVLEIGIEPQTVGGMGFPAPLDS